MQSRIFVVLLRFKSALFWVIAKRYSCEIEVQRLVRLFGNIQSEYRKIQTRKNSVFGHFSCSVEALNF